MHRHHERMHRHAQDVLADRPDVWRNAEAMASLSDPPLSVLVSRAIHALSYTHEQMGDVFGASRNTVGRWTHGSADPSPPTLVAIARAVHPKDPATAAGIAWHAHETLESLGLAASTEKKQVKVRHLADSVLCAMAEAQHAPPDDLRPSLLAAFRRADALGMSVAQVIQGLEEDETPRKPAKPKRA
jgi:hypothetical protein